jgi:hypothetical protein
MFVTGRIARVAAATVCALLVAAGCSSGDDPAPEPTGLIDVTTMRGALLQATEIGPTWQAPQQKPDPNRLVSVCGGTSTPPPVPPGAEVVASSFADEGQKGAQTLDQTALVYPDRSAAEAGQALLRGVAEACQADVSVPATINDQKSEPAYTETVQIQTLDDGVWSGFAVLRHKVYEPKHPGTADTAVVVLHSRNVVLVDTYALYMLNNSSAAPNFTQDWQRLVGSVVKRVG